MNIWDNELYKHDIEYIANLDLPWEKLNHKRLLISGASGMIGSFLIDVIMYRNKNFNYNCSVLALGRNESKIKKKFENYLYTDQFAFVSQDINEPLLNIENVDFIIHAASNTHPVAYSSDPIGTITTNIIGTYNLLKYAVECKTERVLFASSVEIYGENREDIDKFDESYCGYIDCNTIRAGYPESKRAGEALCQAFIKQNGLDVVIARLSRTYGPTMLNSDTKAISQFIKKGVLKEDIVLKSEGTQFYSYSYVADAVSGILTVLLKGKCGEAYNVSDDGSNISLKNLAEMIAGYVGKKIVFEIPNEKELMGYSKATKAVLDSSKLQNLDWKSKYDIKNGIGRTIDILLKVQSTRTLVD